MSYLFSSPLTAKLLERVIYIHYSTSSPHSLSLRCHLSRSLMSTMLEPCLCSHLAFLLSSFQLSWRKTLSWIFSSLKSMITHSGFASISPAAPLFSLCWLLFRRVLPLNVGMPQGWTLRSAFILLRYPLLGSCCKYYLYTNDKCLFLTLTSLLSFGLLHPAFPLVVPVVHLSGISNEPWLCGP